MVTCWEAGGLMFVAKALAAQSAKVVDWTEPSMDRGQMQFQVYTEFG